MSIKMTVYQRIMRAFKRGTGLRLSPEDVSRLAKDDAISTVARNDDECPGQGKCHGSMHWCGTCGVVVHMCDDFLCEMHHSAPF